MSCMSGVRLKGLFKTTFYLGTRFWEGSAGERERSSFEVSGACGTICCQLVKEFPRLKQLSVGCLELSETVSLLQAIPKELKVLKLKIRSDLSKEHAMCIELARILGNPEFSLQSFELDIVGWRDEAVLSAVLESLWCNKVLRSLKLNWRFSSQSLWREVAEMLLRNDTLIELKDASLVLFENCTDDSGEEGDEMTKYSEVLEALRGNFSLVEIGERPRFAHKDNGCEEFYELLERNVRCRKAAVDATFAVLILCKREKNGKGAFANVPGDVIRIIARLVFAIAGTDSWI